MLCWAGNSAELKRQVGSIPGLILIGILVLIQLNSFINACLYYKDGNLKSLVASLIPTIITLIVTAALTLLQFIYNYNITLQLAFMLFLTIISAIIGLGRIKHAPTGIETERFEIPPPFNDFFRTKSTRQE